MMTGFERYTKKTRRALFLEEMELVVPWQQLCALIEPHYPKPGNGRPPVGVERMLRIYFLPAAVLTCRTLAVEEALFALGGDAAVRRLDLASRCTDKTTVCKFRHLLEEYRLARSSSGVD